MEINKHNYQEITSVKEGDRIIFNEDYIYRVAPKYIQSCSGKDNEAIFRKIGVGHNKIDFCKGAYGYSPEDGFCPECRYEDYNALLRLIKKIFDTMYPELKKKQEEFTFEELPNLFVSDHEDCPKPIKVGSSDQKFTVKVNPIKPKIIL